MTGYISLVIKFNILNHMMILASVDYSYRNSNKFYVDYYIKEIQETFIGNARCHIMDTFQRRMWKILK